MPRCFALLLVLICANDLLAQSAPITHQSSSNALSRTDIYHRKYNTIAHRFLDWEAAANRIDVSKYELLDHVLDQIIRRFPEPKRLAAITNPDDALAVLRAVDATLVDDDFVFPPVGWVDSLGDAFDPHRVRPDDLLLIKSKYSNEHREHAIDANKRGIFYYIDCKTSSIVYLAVAELLKIPLFMVDIPGHNFVRWTSGDKSFNWDTNLGEQHSDEEYIHLAHIPPDLLVRKIYLVNMGQNAVFGYWHGIVGDRFSKLKKCEGAMREYRLGAEMYQSSLTSKNNLAWALATCVDAKYRNGSEAIRLSKQVVAIWDNPNFIDTLAAAYAETHDWDNAVASETEAKRLARIQRQSELTSRA